MQAEYLAWREENAKYINPQDFWPWLESAYAAGWCAGALAMRERAAKSAEAVTVRCQNCEAQNEHDQCDHAEPWHYAEAIRTLPV